MRLLLRWFLVPCSVLAAAGVFAWARWLDNGWVVAGYSAAALLILIFWRRATYRLVPSIRSLDWQSLDDRRTRQLKHRFFLSFGLSLSAFIVALLCLVFVPAARTTSGSVMVFAVFVWASIVKFGVFNVLAHHVLQGVSPNTDLPQSPLRGSPSS